MKNYIQLTLLLLAILLPATASAYDIKVDGIYYNINSNTATATVTYQSIDSEGDYLSDYSGNIVIPSSFTFGSMTYSVTSIGAHAFEERSVTSVIIPSTVTTIGSSAFYNCWNLKSVTIGDSVTTISDYAFYRCGLTSVTIPNSVTTIGISAFEDCTALTYVTIGDSVTNFGDYAFSGCRNLRSVAIPNTVSAIGNHAFDYCDQLTSITIPNSVTTIGGGAFYHCSGLTSITIPNSVTTIGYQAFKDCSGMKRVNITDIDSWYNIHFSDSTSNPLYIAHRLFLNGEEIRDLEIPNSVNSIGNFAFCGCNPLTNVTIPNTVTAIGKGAFMGCSGLTSIEIPDSVNSIGNFAFKDCNSLSVIYCFRRTPPLIENKTFYGCTSASLYIPVSALNAYKTANYWKGFNNIFAELFDIEVNGIYYGLNGSNAIVSNIGPSDYHGNYHYSGDITIPSTVTYSGETYSITGISHYAFYGCSDLTSVTIPSSVTNIGDYAFKDCRSLTSISIPEFVTSIGTEAFYGNPLIENVTCAATTPPAWDEISIFSPNVYYHTPLYVPSGKERVYMTDQSWGQFLHIIGIGVQDEVLATGIALNMSQLNLITGSSSLLTATIMPDSATNKTVVWASNDPTIASVNASGLVTAVSLGTVTITASTTDGSNLSASCAVTVLENVVLAISIELNQTSVGMNEGETLQLTATVLPEDATDKTVTWASSDEAVATVDQNGLVTAVAAGTATITASTIDGSDLSASCEVTVNGAATVNNSLDADAFSARCGEEKQLAVRMDNESSITALQCDIYLPAGVSIATEDGDYLIDLVPARKATNHTVSTNDLPNGAIRLFITSATSKPFKGNSGDLFILNLVVDGDAESGEYSLDLRNIILSDTEAHPYYVPDLNVPVTIMDYIKGDVNIDGTVNVSDYVATANYILEMDPHPFLFVAADIDENLTINVSDLVGVANIALNFMGAPAINHAPAMGYNGEGLTSFTANCSTITPNKHVVTLDLSNSSAVTAFQMDIHLPEGLKLVGASLSDRATASHSLEMTTLASGAYRLLGASMMSKAFAGSEGALLTLEIEGTASGMAIIDGIMLAEPDATLHKHDAMTLAFDNTGVQEMMSDVSIYLQDGMVVVESPVASKVQFILPNGMSVVREVKPGRNVYNTGLEGIVIVKVGNQVKKFKL